MSDCIHGRPLYDHCFECFPEILDAPDPQQKIAALQAKVTELESIMADARAVIERQREERLKLEAALAYIQKDNGFHDEYMEACRLMPSFDPQPPSKEPAP